MLGIIKRSWEYLFALAIISLWGTSLGNVVASGSDPNIGAGMLGFLGLVGALALLLRANSRWRRARVEARPVRPDIFVFRVAKTCLVLWPVLFVLDVLDFPYVIGASSTVSLYFLGIALSALVLLSATSSILILRLTTSK